MSSERAIWTCKIGYHPREDLPHGSDAPMRAAVFAAFAELAGVDAEVCFSGWGGELTEGELAVVENREPVYEKTETGKRRLTEDERGELMDIQHDYITGAS